MLGLGGFLVGTGLGIFAIWVINTVMSGVAFAMMTFSVATVLLQPSSTGVLLGLAFATAIGFFGGLPPAWRAAHLRVVEALHRA
jgi:ABC-type antimicrobial peptide transport system permease subunit